MKKYGVVLLMTFSFFILEFLLFGLFGNFFHPNLLLLLLIFFHVRLGFSYSLLAALVGGILKDSFSPGPWGVYVAAFIVCVFLTAPLKVILYQKGYSFSRLAMALSMSLVCALLVYWLYIMRGLIAGTQPFIHILLTEVWATAFLAAFTFHRLKKCVLKLSV